MALLFDGSRFQIEDSASVRRLLGGQLFAHLLHVVGMQVVVEARSEPVALTLMQDRRDAVGHVDQAARVAGGDEQEPVGRFQNQMLQLLIGEKGWFVRAVSARVSRT